MRLHEYQSKGILARYAIPVPCGKRVQTAAAAARVAQKMGRPVAVKGQVLAGGRGKAGLVRIAATPAEAMRHAKAILGPSVSTLLIEEAIDIRRELYLGLVVDRAACRVVLLASDQGGVDIEETARVRPEHVARVPLDPFLHLRSYHIRHLTTFLGLPPSLMPSLTTIADGLYAAFMENDATLVEINPLALTADGRLLALDAKITIDDNALFRHEKLQALRSKEDETPVEVRARQAGLSYVSLEGNIGCIVNGAGLAMATLDAVQALGGKPANFADIGGGARSDRVATALQCILYEGRARAVLVNIFGGITRCDEVAQGLVDGLAQTQTDLPVVVRLAGSNETEGQAILAQRPGIQTAPTLAEAARLVVTAAERR